MFSHFIVSYLRANDVVDEDLHLTNAQFHIVVYQAVWLMVIHECLLVV